MLMFLSMLTALAAASPQAAPADVKNQDPIICEGREASEVGTHMKAKRICLHKSEWEYVHNDMKRQLQDIKDKGTLPTPEQGR